MLKDPKVEWIGETRRTYSSYIMQVWEVLSSSIFWCYGPPCYSLASRSNSRRPGTISMDVPNWKVIRSFDASTNCSFPMWYKMTYFKYFFLVSTLENWKDTFPTELDQKVRLQRLTFSKNILTTGLYILMESKLYIIKEKEMKILVNPA